VPGAPLLLPNLVIGQDFYGDLGSATVRRLPGALVSPIAPDRVPDFDMRHSVFGVLASAGADLALDRVEVQVPPFEGARLLGADPGERRQRDVGADGLFPAGFEQGVDLFEPECLARPTLAWPTISATTSTRSRAARAATRATATERRR